MKILVTADFTDAGIAMLRRHGDVLHEPWSATGKLYMAEELAEKVSDFEIDVLIVEVDLVHEEVFEARGLEAVGCCRSEPINIDIDTATDLGVPVVFAPGRNARSVADLTLALILNLARGVVPMHQRLTSGSFDPSDMRSLLDELGAARGFELASATVGLLGLGAVGRETARRLKAFGSRVISHDPHVSDSVFEEFGVSRVSLDALFQRSDVLSLHCPVTDATRRVVDRERIESMKDGAFLINTARHRLVDGDALLEALVSGKLAGAGLDVFAAEPPLPTDPVLALSNVVCTPHIGGATTQVVGHQTRMVATDIDRVLRGETPTNCANPEVL
ncbi:MAG TPA: 3-phosphoglycerate dehydrogenase [Polyangiaceae bacterium]|nr:3-phosphoglycerate dehydrogenase [Polyangiaceae bacterium]